MAMFNLDLSTILQILLAVIIILVLYVVTLVILNVDTIVMSKSNKVLPQEMIKVIDGYAPISYLGNRTYNTSNPYADNFVKLGKSINTMGGAQFTYQFWIKIDDPNDALFKNLVVLLKGDDRKYKVGLYNSETLQLSSSEKTPDYAVVCPMIKFVDSYRHLKVRLNTYNNPMTDIDINMTPNDSGLGRRNALSLLPLNWYLLTFVFEDNISYQTVQENGINFKFWLNDFLYQENGASNMAELRNNTIKQNDGNLVLFPDPPEQGTFVRIGNVRYYNYSLDEVDIKRVYASGPPTTSAIETEQGKNTPAYLTAYNKVDIYNY